MSCKTKFGKYATVFLLIAVCSLSLYVGLPVGVADDINRAAGLPTEAIHTLSVNCELTMSPASVAIEQVGNALPTFSSPITMTGVRRMNFTRYGIVGLLLLLVVIFIFWLMMKGFSTFLGRFTIGKATSSARNAEQD